MNKKIIGVDIDGVITDEGPDDYNVWHKALCNFTGENLKRVKDAYNFTEAYNLSESIIERFLEKNIQQIYRDAKPARKAGEKLNRLIDKGFYIYLITARDEKYRKLTENWLDRHNIPYHTLIHEGDKAPLVRKLGINLFIEDKAENIKEILEYKIPVIVFDRYHNRSLNNNHKKLYRVNNWERAYEIIIRTFNIEKDKERAG
ncbi:5' nucleotidase, NT5C type [Halothermothrix orenii]|uniref:Nucleotidase n=1 Tax=Halothermothrix orenii (strain H 168 / OCM 544 / DSM 9562) TaxID=373903 RepID=B8CX13_HALOH|nr:hypothetical protein [Halothermothrix orenii]ACL69832.1 uncharacterized conserved protein [Halothermothrix orenii H 168]